MKIGVSLAIILALNMLLLFTQTATDILATQEGITSPQFFNYNNSMISKFNAGNSTNLVLNEDLSQALPEGNAQVETTDGNFFTDVYSAVKSWILGTTGGKFFYGIVNGIPNFLKMIGLPEIMAYGLGFMWHTLTLFLIIAFLKGNY